MKKLPLWISGAYVIGSRPSLLTLISNQRPENVVSSTISGAIAKRSTNPADSPLWLKSGVTSGGRNVFMDTRSTSRGKTTAPPPSVWREEITLSTRVKESKLRSVMSGSSGRLFTGVVTYRN